MSGLLGGVVIVLLSVSETNSFPNRKEKGKEKKTGRVAKWRLK